MRGEERTKRGRESERTRATTARLILFLGLPRRSIISSGVLAYMKYWCYRDLFYPSQLCSSASLSLSFSSSSSSLCFSSFFCSSFSIYIYLGNYPFLSFAYSIIHMFPSISLIVSFVALAHSFFVFLYFPLIPSLSFLNRSRVFIFQIKFELVRLHWILLSLSYQYILVLFQIKLIG